MLYFPALRHKLLFTLRPVTVTIIFSLLYAQLQKFINRSKLYSMPINCQSNPAIVLLWMSFNKHYD